MNYGDTSRHYQDETTYSHEFTTPLSHSPSHEPSPSCVSHHPGAYFNMNDGGMSRHDQDKNAIFQSVDQETNSERSEDEHEEIQDKRYQETYVCFRPNVESNSGNSNSDTEEDIHYQLVDKRLHPAEESQELEEQQELVKLGSHIFSKWEKDNLKAAAYKVAHHVTREAFEGL